MKYKTTYFKLSLNDEISVDSELFYWKKHPNSLTKKIFNQEKNVMSLLKKNQSDIEIKRLNKEKKWENISELDRSELVNLMNSYNFIEVGFRQDVFDALRELRRLKYILDTLDDQRFTKEHEDELDTHLNNMAKNGWKLFSMNEITKGYSKMKSYLEGGAGYGHQVQEGFVMIWEKED